MTSGSAFQIDLDEVTLKRAQNGDMQAFGRIYALFSSPAYTLACRIVKCPDTAQEVLQDAFIVLFRRIGQYRGDAPFWAWLRRVVTNQAIDAIRRRPPEVALDNQWLERTETQTGDHTTVAEQMDIEQALGQLSDEDRAVVWLHDVEGYKHGEIAEMMGKSESYSKSRLSRARSRLAELTRTADVPTGGGVELPPLMPLKAETGT